MPKLFMLLIGCMPKGRNIEQHDVFIGVGESLKDFVPQVKEFWPGVNQLHFDAWREVTNANGHKIEVLLKKSDEKAILKLFFINLGGYKKDEFEEFHYKLIVAAPDKAAAIVFAKNTAFFRHTGFKGANSHIDDKYGVDVDDIHEIADILNKETKEKYEIVVTAANDELSEDEIHLGYFKLSMFE